MRDDIVSSGGLDPLLFLSNDDDPELQQEVLATLCNLSLSGCIGENTEKFATATPVRGLVSFLCSADSTLRLYGAVTIGNLAAEERHQENIVRDVTSLPASAYSTPFPPILTT